MEPWQSKTKSLSDSSMHMLEYGIHHDVVFKVGLPPTAKTFKCHKIILAMRSEIFEAMFYDSPDKVEEVEIVDVEPEIFEIMLKYIYSDHWETHTMTNVIKTCLAAKKYNILQLIKLCEEFIQTNLNWMNVCHVYEFAISTNSQTLKGKCESIIQNNLCSVLESKAFLDSSAEIVMCILQLEMKSIKKVQISPSVGLAEKGMETVRKNEDVLNKMLQEAIITARGKKLDTTGEEAKVTSRELLIFDHVLKWVNEECKRKRLELDITNRWRLVRPFMQYIRFTNMTHEEFVKGPALSKMLTFEEIGLILMNITVPGIRPFQLPYRSEIEPLISVTKALKRLDLHQSCKSGFNNNNSNEASEIRSKLRISGRIVKLNSIGFYISCKKSFDVDLSIKRENDILLSAYCKVPAMEDVLTLSFPLAFTLQTGVDYKIELIFSQMCTLCGMAIPDVHTITLQNVTFNVTFFQHDNKGFTPHFKELTTVLCE